MGSRLNFTPLQAHQPGILHSLLSRSYQELVEMFPEGWTGEVERMREFDREAFGSPDKVGRCVFVTCVGGEPIGLGSYEPCADGSAASVGHNCILPEFRRRGYGRRQLEEIVRRLREHRVERIAATTSEHPFFLPAREMYLSFGFAETGRRDGGPDPGFRLVDYELDLVHELPVPELDACDVDEL
ncbi:GNAT family N-acetyltransferase [candidate division WOR-3 bacterium]|nr:GNAT family N-acetyltransferase [candidate division WOR-3 bacterium]